MGLLVRHVALRAYQAAHRATAVWCAIPFNRPISANLIQDPEHPQRCQPGETNAVRQNATPSNLPLSRRPKLPRSRLVCWIWHVLENPCCTGSSFCISEPTFQAPEAGSSRPPGKVGRTGHVRPCEQILALTRAWRGCKDLGPHDAHHVT